MQLNASQESAIREAFVAAGNVTAVSKTTGHSRHTIRRVLATQGEPAIDYEILAAKVAARMAHAAPVNEGPPTGTEWRQPRQPGIYDAPRIYPKTVWLSDLHYPYQDQAAVDVALGFIRDWRPDLIILGGDVFDSYLISSYTKSPEQLNHHLQREFDLAKPFVKEIDSLGCDVVYILGNHEARIDALKASVPGLSKLRSLEWRIMAELPARWTILPQFARYRIGSLDLHHGDLKQGPGGRFVAARMLEDLKRSSLFGHFHRAQSYTEPDGDGVVRGAFSMPHLCDPVEAAKYCRLNRWATGFGSVETCPTTHLFQVRTHLIHGGRARIQDRTYG